MTHGRREMAFEFWRGHCVPGVFGSLAGFSGFCGGTILMLIFLRPTVSNFMPSTSFSRYSAASGLVTCCSVTGDFAEIETRPEIASSECVGRIFFVTGSVRYLRVSQSR